MCSMIIISEDPFIREFDDSHAGHVLAMFCAHHEQKSSVLQFGSAAGDMKMHFVRHEIIAVLISQFYTITSL